MFSGKVLTDLRRYKLQWETVDEHGNHEHAYII